MTDERFNELINHALAHPVPMLMINRLALALRSVVAATGDVGDAALEEHCRDIEVRDRKTDEEIPW